MEGIEINREDNNQVIKLLRTLVNQQMYPKRKVITEKIKKPDIEIENIRNIIFKCAGVPRRFFEF